MENSFRFGARKMITAAAGVALAASLCAAVPANAYADEATSDTQAALTKVNQLLTEIDSANGDYQSALNDKAQAEKAVKQANKTIKQETKKIDKNQGRLSDRVRNMYRGGQTTILDVLMGSTDLGSFVKNLDLVNAFNENDASLISGLKDSRQKVSLAKAEAQQNADKAAQRANDAKDRRDQANQLAQEAQQAYVAAYKAAKTEAQKEAVARAVKAEAADGNSANNATTKAAATAAAKQITDAQVTKQITTVQGVTKDTANQTTVSQNDIKGFDANTGEATLSNGQKAKVVGYDSSTGNAIVDTAMKYVGGKYVYGAEDAAHSTFDCSGLVQYVYGKNGISVGGHNDRAILNGGSVVNNPQAGDICWWNGHVAIYAGNGKMISADNPSSGITYRNVDKGVTYVRYKGGK
jgi:cell wall-associated NlpC family hydrolase